MNNKDSNNKKKKPDISIENEIKLDRSESDVIQDEIRKTGLRSTSWKGPLPPQIFEKVSSKTADEMVLSLCRRQERQDHIVEKLIESKEKQLLNSNKSKIIYLISTFLFVIILLSICLYFNKENIIKELFQIVGFCVGGGGLATLILKKESTKQNNDIELLEE